jgi:hypothetical protein
MTPQLAPETAHSCVLTCAFAGCRYRYGSGKLIDFETAGLPPLSPHGIAGLVTSYAGLAGIATFRRVASWR